ncbi:MAG: ATP-binding protein [Pseudobdellovibrionaceae bacterium]
MIKRLITPFLASSRKSILLLGPRQTGKSTLIKQLDPEIQINLADQAVFTRFLGDPGLLRRSVGLSKSIMIDEIQRIPSLLNTVQALIDENKERRFFLTGSSARKLRRGEANLLPGRIHSYSLGPLIPLELEENFDEIKACRRGLLPDPYLEVDERSWQKTLRTYAATYLREEIQAEALTRNLEGFSRFFNVAAAWSGDFLDFAKMSSLASIERTSAKRYFEILEDTLIAYRLEAFAKSEKVRLIQHPRFYFFDVGVLNGVMGNFTVSPDRLGRLWEHLVIQTIRATAQALDKDVRMSVFRTAGGAEVDLILEDGSDLFAIEIKAAKKVSAMDFRGFAAFSGFVGKRKHRAFVVSMDERVQEFDAGLAIPLAKLWAHLGWKR